MAQVDRHGPPVGDGRGAVTGQCLAFVFQHLGQVDLVDDGAGWPVQPVSARVQAGRQNHDLPDPAGNRVGEVLVEKVGPHRLVIDHLLGVDGGVGIVVLGPPGGDLLAHSVEFGRGDSGSANWSRISGSVLAVSAARARATITAVAPTLVAMSQESSAVRAIKAARR